MRFKRPVQPAHVTRTTPFSELPEWLSRQEVADHHGIGLRAADTVIRTCPSRRKFGKFIRVHKADLTREVTR